MRRRGTCHVARLDGSARRTCFSSMRQPGQARASRPRPPFEPVRLESGVQNRNVHDAARGAAPASPIVVQIPLPFARRRRDGQPAATHPINAITAPRGTAKRLRFHRVRLVAASEDDGRTQRLRRDCWYSSDACRCRDVALRQKSIFGAAAHKMCGTHLNQFLLGSETVLTGRFRHVASRNVCARHASRCFQLAQNQGVRTPG